LRGGVAGKLGDELSEKKNKLGPKSPVSVPDTAKELASSVG